MSDQVYHCGIRIDHPLVACAYATKANVCTLQPHTPCEYKYKVGNLKEVSDEEGK